MPTKEPKKPDFEVLTSIDYDSIPKNVLVVKDKYGWMFIARKGTKWYVNHTDDNKDGKKMEEGKFIKELIKVLKAQLKEIKQ